MAVVVSSFTNFAVINSPTRLFFSSPSPNLHHHRLHHRHRHRHRHRLHHHKTIAVAMASNSKLMEFPYTPAPIRDLMIDLISTLESTLGSDLLPCTLPENVQYYQNQTNTSHAALQIRSGSKSNKPCPIDFVLASWLHSRLPSGADLHISSLSAYLNCSTDAPHFLIELIQTSPTSLILILDLLPRKDLVLHPDYLKKHYEDAELDKERELVSRLPEITPYVSSSLYIRSVVSPTAILVRVDTAGDERRMEEIVEGELTRVAKRLLQVWLRNCEIDGGVADADSAAALKIRDGVIKKKTVEIDLGSSLPSLFGQDIADTVLDAIHHFFI